MRDTWLDESLRKLEGSPARPGFSGRVLTRLRERQAARRARYRWWVVSTSAMAATAAVLMLALTPSAPREVTADELAALRAELSSLRAALPAPTFEIETPNSGELQVDMEALLSTSAAWRSDGRAADTVFVAEGGQL